MEDKVEEYNLTPINKAIKTFEAYRDKAELVRDVLYLDGVLAVLDTLLPYEQEYLKGITNE